MEDEEGGDVNSEGKFFKDPEGAKHMLIALFPK